MYDALERRDESAVELKAALAMEQSFLDADPDDRSARRRLSTVHHWLGRLYENRGDLEAANHHMSEMLRLRRAIADDDPQSALHRPDVAVGLDMKGSVLRETGRKEEALDLNLQANRIFRDLAEQDPSDADLRRSLAVSCYFLGLLQREMADETSPPTEADARRARLEQARSFVTQSRSIMERLRDDDLLPPGDADVIQMLATPEGEVETALGD